MLRNCECKAKCIVADVSGIPLLAFNSSNTLISLTSEKEIWKEE